MTVKGTCVHQNIMLMPVSETKEFVQIIIRIRKCDKCGEKVKTLELTEERLENERQAARERINGQGNMIRENLMIINAAIDVLNTVEKKGKNKDGNKGEH
ncbi:hypothetical protein ES708_27983 [subsurface metagenome]